ncbi:MAG TPA: helix-turn-helix transcriptional regulator [Iamia sp.]|nr:helix-turn-helix transcriptional regulator [Iamia sp.]
MEFLSGEPRDLDGHHLWTARYRMRAGEAFTAHSHPAAQVAWSPDGVITATVEGTAFVLTPGQALWIPVDAEHELACRTDAVVHCTYVDPASEAIRWPTPTPFAVTPLVQELFALLAGGAVDAAGRRHAEDLLLHLMQPGSGAALPVRLPTDSRAREVATALLADPADGRTLEQWGRTVGASSRTLARAFTADTGLGFTAWRTQARLCAALEQLGAGRTPAQVARRVGYTNPRAFAAAFRRTLGTTPQDFVAAGVARSAAGRGGG